MDAIGVVAEPDHPVFGGAGERLAVRGFDVRFFQPGEPLVTAALDDLDALGTASLDPATLRALRVADRRGVETLNGFLPTTALGSRLVAFAALERAGSAVPRTWVDADGEPPAGTPVERRHRYRWPSPDPTEGYYQEIVAETPVRHRYYAVDDGVETHVNALELRSELEGSERAVTAADVDVERATRLREVLDRFDARAVTVDFVGGDDGWYAVDVDPAPGFVHADMERHLADALASLTTIGA